MMLYATNDGYVYRQALHAAKLARAKELRRGAELAESIITGEPSPSDYMMLHDPVVSPDLRSRIISARKIMANLPPEKRYSYFDQITPLADAIQDMIDRYGSKFMPLMRLISPASLPGTTRRVLSESAPKSANGLFRKFAGDPAARRAYDINFLVDARIPPAIRKRLIAAKDLLEQATPQQRRTMLKSAGGTRMKAEIDSLTGRIGAEGVAALNRLLVA